jgi:C1A family cysteine protease
LYNYGCEGGNTEEAFDYVMYAGGIASEADYEYTSGDMGITGTCRTKIDSKKVTISEWYTIDSEDSMIDYVLATGPLSVCIDADELGSYTGGVISSCGTDVDHCVQVVGVNKKKDYWIIRNSWGSHWGDSGYAYLKTGQDTCAITTDPIYTVPSAV